MPASSSRSSSAAGRRPVELRSQRSLTDDALAKKAAARREKQQAAAAAAVVDVSAAAPPTTRIEALFQTGKTLYGEGRFEKSLGVFKKALWYCSCHRDQLMQLKAAGMSLDLVADACSPCSCKDFLDAARRPSLAEPAWAVWNVADERVTSVYSLAERDCSCGSGQRRCASLVHLQVLDACSAACHELGDYKQALDFGTMMINMAPGRPTGYLRTAKLVSKHAPRHVKGLETDIIRSLYKQGLVHVKRLGNEHDQGYKILVHNYMKMSRCDIFLRLPAELQIMVSSKLGLRDRIHCISVSKTWKQLWENTPGFWRQLDFDKGTRPRPVHLRRMIHKYSGRQATRIVIKDCGSLWLNEEGVSIVTDGLPRLRHVELGFSDSERLFNRSTLSTRPSMQQPPSPNHCETLVLNRLGTRNHPLFENFMGGARQTLKKLVVVETPLFWPVYTNGPMLSLTCLQLIGSFGDSDINMDDLLINVPNIAHLYIDDYVLKFTALGPSARRTVLRKLQSVVFGSGTTAAIESSSSFSYRCFPPLPSSIKSIDILSNDLNLANAVLGCEVDIDPDPDDAAAAAVAGGGVIRFEHLESFRCLAPLEPDEVVRIVSATTALRTFEVGGCGDYTESIIPTEYDIPAAIAARVQTAGMYDFYWPSRDTYDETYTGQPFVDWLAATFPDVDTVSAYPKKCFSTEKMIYALVWSGRYKTIYQSCLQGAGRDEVLALAKEKGVKIVHTIDPYRPPVFPWPEGSQSD